MSKMTMNKFQRETSRLGATGWECINLTVDDACTTHAFLAYEPNEEEGWPYESVALWCDDEATLRTVFGDDWQDYACRVLDACELASVGLWATAYDLDTYIDESLGFCA